MPMIDADGCLINVSVEGRDGGPTLMLSNSLGCTLQMWEPQMKALTQVFRVIRYDRRGHGKSNVPPGPYTMAYGTEGICAMLGGKVVIHRPGQPAEEITPEPLANPLRNGPEYFMHCLVTGEPIKGCCSAATSRDAQEILEAGLRSADTGRHVQLPIA